MLAIDSEKRGRDGEAPIALDGFRKRGSPDDDALDGAAPPTGGGDFRIAEAAEALHSETVEDRASVAGGAAGQSLDDRMRSIRKALKDLGDAPAAGPAPTIELRSPPPGPRPELRRRDERDTERDELKSRVDMLTNGGRNTDGGQTPSSFDVARLRRSHEKRARKLLRSKSRRRKDRAFRAGFMLVALAAAAMVGVYVLHPQIIAAQPQLEPMITKYVIAVDQYRAEVNDQTAPWREWLAERIAALRDANG
jgi:hypothetical protein